MSQKLWFDPKWRIKIRFFCHNSESIQNFFNLLFAFIWCCKDANFVEKKVFQKIKDGGLHGFFYFSRHLGFFEKLFFHKICVFVTPNECKKKIEKMLDALKVMAKTLILICHFGSNRHF
jgi:hypothetical protein